MKIFFQIISSLLFLFSLTIILRILLSWFRNMYNGKLTHILAVITDPYLNWCRRRFKLQIGVLDFSIIIALLFLSVAQTIFTTLAIHETISLRFILFVCLDAVWMVVSFILSFFIIILVLRLIAYFSNRNIYTPFWQVIDTISRPILYRINRICFGKRLVMFRTGILTAIILLLVLRVGGYFGIKYLSVLLLL